ncbi:MAG: dihydrodipicolinate synthase family protein [SAR202 cluster bacterium]|jgi:dihydrodipicolinate synthase/N-acetylneuraminate lyase|nr:dihydrodipicolinate synthase family protein [SAR202 cluster bacterium]MDP6512111.1 dihydrodipicolinate synthase family protein [SAR202 cluster bacterium]MDP6714421.1 dihydrodipicolinate synthase family protein [SAR202 cluster bacterium]
MLTDPAIDTLKMIRPNREITGISATLLPFSPAGEVDWDSFNAHVSRTSDEGLTPAVNMDTGYINLLDDDTRHSVLVRTQEALDGRPFVAGAFVGDQPDDQLDLDEYRKQIELIQRHGGTPVIFQSYGLTQQASEDIVGAYADLGRECTEFIAFELGKMFAPFGQIYDVDTFGGLMQVPQCIGSKHSSLDRSLEWERLVMRDQRRPDFKIFTGNDLGIDMVMYGSDYLLGLSTFAPDLFARRDAMWAAGDPGFYQLNDLLQYLGFFAFREPVPAYKHSAAQFLKLRGWISHDAPHPDNLRRPDSDVEILRDIVERLEAF